jgi:hypothetical protein
MYELFGEAVGLIQFVNISALNDGMQARCGREDVMTGTRGVCEGNSRVVKVSNTLTS